MSEINILKLISDALKLKDEIAAIGKKIDENIKSEKDAKRRKKLQEACEKALSGDDPDFRALRKLMFPYAK